MTREGLKFILIGHPVGHSLSPVIHQTAYREMGLGGNQYVAVDCADPASVREQMDSIRRGEVAGANVTVPWKRLALELSDELDDSAKSTGAANVLCGVGAERTPRIVAHNTDVPALSRELSRGKTHVRTAAVIGSGGAALAAVAACRAIGVTDVVVVARRFRGEQGSWQADDLTRLGARPVAWPDDAQVESEWRSTVCQADLIVQSTSDGMAGATDGATVERIVPWADLPKGAFVYDLVYNPEVTRFVAAARAHGLHAESGLGMLVGQAALAIELWLGERPPEAPMRAAALRALAEKNAR